MTTSTTTTTISATTRLPLALSFLIELIANRTANNKMTLTMIVDKFSISQFTVITLSIFQLQFYLNRYLNDCLLYMVELIDKQNQSLLI